MDYKVHIGLAAIMIGVIAAIRRRLVTEVQGTSLLVFHNKKTGIAIYSLLFLPGTLLHELSHWLVAEILQVPTGKLTVLPDFEANASGEQKLGYVMTGRTGPFKSFLIGFAPFFTGIGALVILGYQLDQVWSTGPWWLIALYIYGLIVVGNSMIVSKQDSRNWPLIAILAVTIVYLASRLGITMPASIVAGISNVMVRINQALGLTIGLNLAMIASTYTLRRILEKVTKQKVVIGR